MARVLTLVLEVLSQTARIKRRGGNPLLSNVCSVVSGRSEKRTELRI